MDFFKPKVFKSNEEVNTNFQRGLGWSNLAKMSVLNVYTDIVDTLSLIEVGERFANAKERSRNEFGTFTEKDLH